MEPAKGREQVVPLWTKRLTNGREVVRKVKNPTTADQTVDLDPQGEECRQVYQAEQPQEQPPGKEESRLRCRCTEEKSLAEPGGRVECHYECFVVRRVWRSPVP